MNIRQLTHFIAVAETLSFRKAAELLHMAQPPLSLGIKRLENELGATLFERGRRGVQLTALGTIVLAEARQIGFHIDQIRRAVEIEQTGLGAPLRIGFIGSATYALLPRVLPAFRERHPATKLVLREGTSAEILRDVERGDLDLGLVRIPLPLPTPNLVVPVEWDRLIVALPLDHPLCGRRSLSMRDLADQQFILYSQSTTTNLRHLVMLACQTAGFLPNVAQEAVQVQTIISLVESGIGIALVPSASSADSARRVAFRRLDAPVAGIIAIAVAVPHATETTAARQFRELALELAPADASQAGRRPGAATSASSGKANA